MWTLDDGDVQIACGDAITSLQAMPAGVAQTCITSPPFWGLRDYGTGTWDGGRASGGSGELYECPTCSIVESIKNLSSGCPKCGQTMIPYDCDHIAHKGAPAVAGGLGYPAGGGKRRITESNQYGEAYTQQFRDVCAKCGAQRVDQQIGLEASPDQWVARLVDVFREVRRVLRNDGTLWLEVGDSYAANQSSGSIPQSGNTKTGVVGAPNAWGGKTNAGPPHPFKPKDLVGAPWLLAFALRNDGWYLRSDTIWSRPNPMPESVTDRPTKAHSYIFLLTKQPRYFYDQEAIREPVSPTYKVGAGLSVAPHGEHVMTEGHRAQERRGYDRVCGPNARSVWTIPTEPTPFAHFATFPQELVRRCILAGTSERGQCPACGAPWTRQVERQPDDREQKAYTAVHRTPISGGPTKPKVTRDEGGSSLPVTRKTTTGWWPTCRCISPTDPPGIPATPIPQTVLDPFMGSGTTALVARTLGRHAIGSELNAAYLDIARTRLQQLSLLGEGAA